MAHVERIRSFIAFDIGDDVRAALHAVMRSLARSGADARWVRPEGMHATIKFLGGVEPTRLQAVRDAIAPVIAACPPMSALARGLGAFPSIRRPRVLWAGLECSGVTELARGIDTALVPLGFAAEQRAFHPHVTLARIRTARGLAALQAAVERHRDEAFGSVAINSVVVYRSRLHRDGSTYEALWTIPLAQHK